MSIELSAINVKIKIDVILCLPFIDKQLIAIDNAFS